MLGSPIASGRLRLLIALVACLAVLPLLFARLAAPPPAHAQGGLQGLLGQLTGGNQGGNVLGPLGELLCPVVTDVDELLGETPVVGDVTAALRGLVCNLGLAEFRFRTVWRAPNGNELRKLHNAVLGVPKLMNVDNVPGPDLMGTIAPSGGLTGLQLTINRFGGSAPLPVLVETLVRNPTGGSLGANTIGFGYDQRDDRAPNGFTARLGLASLISPAGDPKLDVDINQSPVGFDTDLIASFFNGPSNARVDETAGRLEFQNSPTILGIDLTLGDPLEVAMHTNVTGPLNASLTQEEGTDERSFSARIEDLPRRMNLTIGQADPRVVYTGTDVLGVPQTIGNLTLNASSTQPLFSRAHHLAARIAGLPSGTELNFDQASNSVALNATQPIASVELFAGSDPEQAGDLPPAGEQGARIVDRTGDPFVIGARVFSLKSIVAGLAGPYTLHTETAGGPFSIFAGLEDIEANVEIHDLPSVLDLTADLDAGTIDYTGSAEIGTIDIDLLSDTALFETANELSLLLEGVPTAFGLNFSPSATNFAFSSTGGIDKIEALAKSPAAADDSGVLPANTSGAVLRRLGADTFVFARLFDLLEVSVGLDPIDVSTRMEAGRPFLADLILEQPGGAPNLDLDALVENLPAELDLGIGDDGTGGTEIDYTASGPINRIAVDATGLEVLPGADDLEAELNSIPTAFTLALPASGPVASLDVPSGQLGQVRVAAGSLGLPGTTGDDNLTYRDLPGNFGVSGRLSAIRNFSLGLDPVALDLGLSTTASERKAIDLDAEIQEAAADPVQDIVARLDKPSASTSLDLVTAEGEPTELDYSGSSVIATIDLRAENLGGLPLIDGELHTIPTDLEVCFDPGPGCQRPNPHNIGRQQTSILSLDIDDLGSSSSPLVLTSADIVTEAGADPIEIRDIRLRELGVDIGLHPDFGFPGNTFGHVFIDTDNRPFSIDRVTYDTVSRFAVGTPGDPASAQDRLLNINGTNTVLGVPVSINTQTRGSFDCGGQRVLDISGIPVFGTINILDLPIIGQAIPLCSS